MIFTLLGGRLGLLHLHDCRVAWGRVCGGLSLGRIMCLSFVGELTLGCDGGAGVVVASDRIDLWVVPTINYKIFEGGSSFRLG